MSTENERPAEGDLDSLMTGIMEVMDKNPELKALAGNLASADLSPLLGLLGSMEKPTPQGEALSGAGRAEALLNALKPFLNPSRASQVDRALQMLSTAKTVRTAIHAFGAMSGNDISV